MKSDLPQGLTLKTFFLKYTYRFILCSHNDLNIYNFAHGTMLYSTNKEFEAVFTNLEISLNNVLAGFNNSFTTKLK